MAGSGSGHDQSTDIFSAEGRVFQVEYAGKAVDASGTAVAACCRDGVVLVLDRIHSSRMLEFKANYHMHAIDRHAGLCICGLVPDGKTLLAHARSEAANSRNIFAMPISGSSLASRVGEYMHAYTTHFMYRPFGCAVMIASYGNDGPRLHVCDPSGTVAGYYATALGKAKTLAKSELEKLNFGSMSCVQAVPKLANILHELHDKQKDKLYDIEAAWVCDQSHRKFEHVSNDLLPPHPTTAATTARASEGRGNNSAARAGAAAATTGASAAAASA